MSFAAYMLRKFPSVIKYANKESAVLKRLKKAVAYAYNSKLYANKLSKAGVRASDIKSIKDFKENGHFN